MGTYPNESWPVDSAVENLDGTTEVLTGLPYIAKGTSPASVPSYEVQYNRRERRLNAILAGWRQGMVVDEGGLKIGVYPIDYTQGGARRSFLGATGVSVPDNSNKVVYLDSSTTLQVANSWPADMTSYLPLAVLVTVNGTMSIGDQRVLTAFHVPSVELNLRDRRTLTVHRTTVGNNESGTEIFEFDPAENLTLEEVQVYCTAMTATASVDVKEAGTSMLSAAATPVAGSVVKPTIADASLSSANNLIVHVTTNGSGTISDLTVTLFFKAALAV